MNWDIFTDQYIIGVLQKIKSDYFIMATIFGPGILWAIKKFTGWTPWKSDDDLADKLADRIGLGKSGDNQ